MVRNRIAERELSAAAGEIGAALGFEAGQLEVASLEFHIGLHAAGRDAPRAQIPTADFEPSLAIRCLARAPAFDPQAARKFVPRRAEQSGQGAQVADIRIDIELERRLAPVGRCGRQSERAAQFDVIRFLPQVAFVEPDATAGNTQAGSEFLDRIFAPGKILRFEPQGCLAGERLARVAVESQLGQT